jgi:hypothetical protein
VSAIFIYFSNYFLAGMVCDGSKPAEFELGANKIHPLVELKTGRFKLMLERAIMKIDLDEVNHLFKGDFRMTRRCEKSRMGYHSRVASRQTQWRVNYFFAPPLTTILEKSAISANRREMP